MKNKIIFITTPMGASEVERSRLFFKNQKGGRRFYIKPFDGSDNLSAAETEDFPLYKFRKCQQQKAIYNVEYLRDRKNKALENSLFGYQRNPWLSEKTVADMEKHIKAASERLRRLGKNAGYSAEIFRKACAAMNKLKNNDN